MPSKKSTKVVPACLDPRLRESLGLFSSRRPAGRHRHRRTDGPRRDESRIRGRSWWHRALAGVVWRSRPRTGHRAQARPHLRGKTGHRRGTHAGRWGRSSLVRRVQTRSLPSVLRRRGRRTGPESGTPRGTRGNSVAAWPRAPCCAPSLPGVARPAAHNAASGRANPQSPFAGVAEPVEAPRAPSQVRAIVRGTKPSPNCAGSRTQYAKKSPGAFAARASSLCFVRRTGPERSYSFFTASVSAGTASKRSATRK